MVTQYRFKQAEIGRFNTTDTDPVVSMITSGCRVVGLTMGRFSLIDLIHGILKKIGKSHVVVATWSAGIKDANQVKWMIDTDLISTFRLLTDHSYKTRQSRYAVSIEEIFGLESIRTSEMHAKFTLIHNDDYKITIRTSMNLNANKTCETFEIDDDQEIFNFYMSFVEHTFGEMPRGFVPDSYTANNVLEKYFTINTKTEKLWTEI